MAWSMTVPREDDREFEQAPVTTCRALLYGMIDVGTHKTPYLDEKTGEPKYQRQIAFMFEMDDDERMSDGRRFSVTGWYTRSLDPKANLRKMLESWRGVPLHEGEEFDLSKVHGKTCLLSTKLNTRGNTTVGSVNKPMKGMEPLTAENKLVAFNLDDPDWDAYAELSEWFQAKIAESPEYKALRSAGTSAPASPPPSEGGDGFDDDIPF